MITMLTTTPTITDITSSTVIAGMTFITRRHHDYYHYNITDIPLVTVIAKITTMITRITFNASITIRTANYRITGTPTFTLTVTIPAIATMYYEYAH